MIDTIDYSRMKLHVYIYNAGVSSNFVGLILLYKPA